MSDQIHTGLSKDQAYELMLKGHKITHEYYTDDEFLYIENGIIRNENGYNMGTKNSPFWRDTQKWETGWSTYN